MTADERVAAGTAAGELLRALGESRPAPPGQSTTPTKACQHCGQRYDPINAAGRHPLHCSPDCLDAELQAGEDADALRKARARDRARKQLADEQRPPAPPLDLDLLTDVLARPPEPPYRVDRLIPSDAGTLVVAQRKTGKTTLLLNLARCLLTGEPFLDRFDVRPVDGRIALLNFEVSARQLATWAADVDIPADRLILVNLRGRRNPLDHADDRNILAAKLRTLDTRSVIVDPFGRAYTGKSQNDSGEVGAWLADLDRWVRGEVGASDLILTAHAGWEAERTRGASALEDWADTIVTLVRDKDDESQRYLRAMGRDVDIDEDLLAFDPQTRRLSLTGDGSRRAVKATERLDQLVAAVVEHVSEAPGLNVTQLAERMKSAGVPHQKGDVSKAVHQAAQLGSIRREDGARGAKLCYPNAPTPTYPDVPHGAGLTYPDPPLVLGVGQRGNSQPTYPEPQTTCSVCLCSLPSLLIVAGKTTHPDCDTESTP